MRKLKLRLPLKTIAIIIIAILITSFILTSIIRILAASDYLKIGNIIVKNDIADLSYLKGKNIFTVDLGRESRYILNSHPEYRRIRIIRLLPNQLFVDFVKRNAVAYIKLYRYFCVDEEMVLFYPQAGALDPQLPVVLGLETKIFGPKSGKRYNTKELQLALEIIRETKKSRDLRGYQIKIINLTNPSSVSFFLIPPCSSLDCAVGGRGIPQGIEIKIGQEDITDKIDILSKLLMQEKNNLGNIKYIDLRFNEPAIKLKDVK